MHVFGFRRRNIPHSLIHTVLGRIKLAPEAQHVQEGLILVTSVMMLLATYFMALPWYIFVGAQTTQASHTGKESDTAINLVTEEYKASLEHDSNIAAPAAVWHTHSNNLS